MREAKPMAERILACCIPDDKRALRLRANACEALGDLRQALRDWRRIAELCDSVEPKASAESVVGRLETKLREQVAAQVAAARAVAAAEGGGGR